MSEYITPVMYVDPSGEFAFLTIAVVSLIIGSVAGGFELGMQYSDWENAGNEDDFWDQVDWFSVGIEAGSAAVFTALTMASLGSSTAASSSWYMYSRLGLTGTTQILRGINAGDSVYEIVKSTTISIALTYAFVRVGSRPMATSILDPFTNYYILAPLITIQIMRQTGMESARYFGRKETWNEINQMLEFD